MFVLSKGVGVSEGELCSCKHCGGLLFFSQMPVLQQHLFNSCKSTILFLWGQPGSQVTIHCAQVVFGPVPTKGCCCCVHVFLCLQHYTKHEIGAAGDAISRAPEAAVSAVGTAGEIISGVAGHMVDKVGENTLVVNLAAFSFFRLICRQCLWLLAMRQ